MTSQDFEDKISAIVTDLQTKGKGKTVNVLLRDVDNSAAILPLSSDPSGVVNVAQLTALQNFIRNFSAIADDYNFYHAPVLAANEAFKTAQIPHQGLIDAAAVSRNALQTALANDAAYQSAKTAVDNARNASAYTEVLDSYKQFNVSENFTELSQAKGAYVA